MNNREMNQSLSHPNRTKKKVINFPNDLGWSFFFLIQPPQANYRPLDELHVSCFRMGLTNRHGGRLILIGEQFWHILPHMTQSRRRSLSCIRALWQTKWQMQGSKTCFININSLLLSHSSTLILHVWS